MTHCTLCGLIAPVTQRGSLWLCSGCIMNMRTPSCETFQHAYRGAALDGQQFWVCTRCGTTLLSVPATETPTPVPQQTYMDYC